MRGTFGKRIDELSEAVGEGHLKGSVEVDQIYAHYQHAHEEFNHPMGGKANYLRDPLFQNGPNKYMRDLAKGAITEDGSDIESTMADCMEHLSTEGVFVEAPWEFGDLRASGHPKVESGKEVIYDRPPLVARLTESELEAKHDLHDLGLGN